MVTSPDAVRAKAATRWQVGGASVRGASHKRKGLPNQDAIHGETYDDGAAAIVAVADGHGSADYFRSDRGAKLAVEIAGRLLREVLQYFRERQSSSSAVKDELADRIPQRLARAWTEHILRDVEAHPFSEQELAAAATRGGSAKAQATPQLAYGCTLLAVLVTEAFTLYLQLGDGDILAVSEGGEVSRPVDKDPRLIANETTSLCSPEAWRKFSFEVVAGPPPALILVSTDGYSNSFRDEQAFLQVGPDILQMTKEKTFEEIQQSIEGWLDRTSAVGSGDDVTLAIIKRMRDTDPQPVVARLSLIENSVRGMEERQARAEETLLGLRQSTDGLEGLSRELNELRQKVDALEHANDEHETEMASLRRRHGGTIRAALILLGLSLAANLIFAFAWRPAPKETTQEQTASAATPAPQPAGTATPAKNHVPGTAATPAETKSQEASGTGAAEPAPAVATGTATPATAGGADTPKPAQENRQAPSPKPELVRRHQPVQAAPSPAPGGDAASTPEQQRSAEGNPPPSAEASPPETQSPPPGNPL